MATKFLTKTGSTLPTLFTDFFKPWNEWVDGDDFFGNKAATVPAVNIKENKNDFTVSMAVPGMKKDDFKIELDGNMLTISSEKEENKEEKESKYTRKEYSYSSFSRSFTLPEDVNREAINAAYNDGVLVLTLPKKEEVKKETLAKTISVK